MYVVVESVYSMDGDFSPISDLVQFCEENHAILIVDEAHSVGVFGKKGEGLVCSLEMQDRVPIRVVTFGKAIGAHGAAVLCSKRVKDYLINFSRSFIYTTALSPQSISDVVQNYTLLQSSTELEKLRTNILFFKSELEKYSQLKSIESESAIQCIFIGDGPAQAIKYSELLSEKGFDVRAILFPTVKEGTERLRICLHSFHTKVQITSLLKYISEVEV